MDDIQSWWEVPSIAHFCSLFRVAFNLLDFDIEELEEALLTDGAELSGSSLLQELIVRLLCGCLGNNGISVFNYQMFLRRLFRTKSRELGRENPFDTDIDFQFLPLRTKVEILHALCDFRLDADDVIDVLKNLDSDSLRVHPLGYDDEKSAYWYFYGTRLYKEEFPRKRRKKKDHDKQKSKRKRKDEDSSSSEDDEEPRVGTWKVLCFTEDDWQNLADSLSDSNCKEEQALYTVLTEDFLPEIPRLFEEKERLQRKRLMENQPRRTSSRIKNQALEKENAAARAKEEKDYKENKDKSKIFDKQKQQRSLRASTRSRSKSESGCSSAAESSSNAKQAGRQTNNSLSSATGKIVIQQTQKSKLTHLSSYRRSGEDLMTGMYKVLDRLKVHDDAWPFADPVEEKYAPKYYSVIAKPMDLQAMEDKLDNGEYGSVEEFKADFKLIVDNCRQYNGSENDYTKMVVRLKEEFDSLVERYLELDPSSEEEPRMPSLTSANVMRRVSRTPDDSPPSSLDRNSRSSSRLSISGSERSKNTKRAPSIDSDKDSGRRSRESINRYNRNRKKVRRKRKMKGIKRDRSSSLDKTSRDTSLERSRERTRVNYKEKDSSGSEFSDSSTSRRQIRKAKRMPKKTKRHGALRNAADIEALEIATEQTLRDLNKWLDETPRFSDFSSNSNSPLHIPCTEDMATIDSEYRRRLQMDRPSRPRDRFSNDRRRMFKDQMGIKRKREIQRTIDRLQPGKSKGNLLSKDNHQDPPGTETKQTAVETDENTPKLSLGKVLASDLIGFGMGIVESVRRDSEDELPEDKPPIEVIQEVEDKPKEVDEVKEVEKEVRKEVEEEKPEPKKEKPTPNLSAWFKAFGAPKLQNSAKKKAEDDKKEEDDDDKDKRGLILQSPARRQRRTSTGSSVSERSSFSQDPLDGNSPRPSLDEQYMSPQPEVKNYYHHSPINGTINVGFYQDTCFPKGSSEKSGSPRDLPSCSPRDMPIGSPRTPYCSPRRPTSPREYPMTHQDYNSSPRDTPNELVPSPKPDYPPYTTQAPQNPRLYPGVPPYPSHLPYYETPRPIPEQQYKPIEKTQLPIYPVKKRAYNDIEANNQEPAFKGGSFIPTKNAMEQDRTFTPTPGRMPNQPIRMSDPSITLGLPHHPLQQHLLEQYGEDRHLPSTYYNTEGIYAKGQPPLFAQSSVISSNYRDSNVQQSSERQPEGNAQSFNRVLPVYHSENRADNSFTSASPSEKRPKTPVPYPESPSGNSGPINYSSAEQSRQQEVIKPNSPISFAKVPAPELIPVKGTTSFASYPTNTLDEMMKVSSPYQRPISQLPPPINYPNPNPADLSKMGVPPLGYGNQPEIIAAKMNYNHPMADIMQSSSRYNYPMPELSKGGVYNHGMPELIQAKPTTAYPPMPTFPTREMSYSPRTLQPTKPEPQQIPKQPKKPRKKKNEVPSGFQQYVAPASEGISLKPGSGVSGSAFNFGPPLKEGYGAYLEDMRSPYYVPPAEPGAGKAAAPAPAAYPFLGHGPRAPAYPPHPFMNPQYQQYLQRHPEELLRPMMISQGLLPPPAGYPAGYLGMPDPRHAWL